MRDATPQEPDPRSSERLARPTARVASPRTGFVLSLLSAIGAAATAIVAPWPFIDPNLGRMYSAIVILSALIVLPVSLALAILGLSRSVAWRQAGGRSRLNVLGIVLACLAIDVVALGIMLLVAIVAVIIIAFSQI